MSWKFGPFWSKLNRPQKIFYSFLALDGDINNGGVWQFLFNSPELSLAALETLQTIGADKLARDYHATLQELAGKADTVAQLRRQFDDKKLSSQRRWSAFVKGYETLTSARRIQDYYYTAKFKRPLYRKMSDYVESKLSFFANFK